MPDLEAALQPDLTQHDCQPVNLQGSAPSFGALIALSADWRVIYCSDNAGPLLGLAGLLVPGAALSEVLLPAAVEIIQELAASLPPHHEVARSCSVQVTDRMLADVAVYRRGGDIVAEFEHHFRADRNDYIALMRSMFDQLAEASSVAQLTDLAAQNLRTLTGFEQVMVYRFESDGTGNVVAESCQPDARSVAGSRNLGTAAEMSLPIFKRGRQWGLFACHHPNPHGLPLAAHAAAELFGQMFSLILDRQETETERRELTRTRAVHDQIMLDLAGGRTLETGFAGIIAQIRTMIPHDGAVGWVEGRFQSAGNAPDRQQFLELARFLNAKALTEVFHTDELAAVLPAASRYVHLGAGILVIPVSRNPRDYIVLFRGELARSIAKADDFGDVPGADQTGKRPSLRKGFAASLELVHGKCAHWSDCEVQAANALQITLRELVLRMVDATLQERRNAEKQQEVLIAELNHRVRNILNLVRSLISQSQSGVTTVSAFTAVVGQRVHALARAHDLITKGNWSPASAHQLIRTEADGYLGTNAARLTITGPDPKLTPEAVTTCALVIHELMTNSVKYGAISQPGGTLQITFARHTEGGVEMVWQEHGGPPITAPPVRRGFGSTLIERSIPFELGGIAELDFAAAGLRAWFCIPSRHVTGFDDTPPETGHKADAEPALQPLSNTVLLVEDNMLIALDAEDMLITLGAADVLTASTVFEAFQKIDAAEIKFAVLDVNLGNENTEPVAQKLRQRGVPFLFATGYGETSELAALFPGAVILQKPYEVSALRSAITRAITRATQR